ncbi:MAG: DUF2309 domain-containing protein [Burkholderiaceae bacterium]|nr:DUF2309 domain-containing protein [Burkholderiaceae bacterium]
MNAPLTPDALHAQTLADAVADACGRIAPSWPLDRFIAVNPHWGWTDRPIAEAAATVGVLAGMRLVPDASPARRPLLADLAGRRDAVVHQISQHCAAYFDDGQARWHAAIDEGLYAGWRRQLPHDRGMAWPPRRAAALALLADWPDEPMAAIDTALKRLQVPADGCGACLTAWLMDLNGWASACAWRHWQAGLTQQDAHDLRNDLLAMRATWDALLADALPGPQVADWATAWSTVPAAIAAERARQAAGWARMGESEAAAQREVMAAITQSARAPAAPPVPRVQAVFCIDVRSEPLRRALEAADPTIHTRGFAGFFGLPAAHRPLGSDWQQPQLPGLLAPAVTIDDGPADRSLGEALVARRRARLAADASWDGWRGTPAHGFGFVESCGLLYAADLLRQSLPSTAAPQPWQVAGLRADEVAALRPALQIDPAAGARLAAGVLRAMGMTRGFAPLVLLCGHGGQSANNPHAAGLDCGACGGQTGEVNARALAALLNDAAVRDALRAEGIDIPAGTHVLAGLHGTTTDEVTLYDTAGVPDALRAHLAALQQALAAAGDAVRAERAPGLGLPAMAAPALRRALQERANHWAETRPEWALADNAAFVGARALPAPGGADLGGRAFLHDYDHRLDPDRNVLTLILTAPVVVAHWINLQYLASSVDPQRQGSGNKLLHNVVGGGIGVFEGNGGDLRIGLPWQSVHDGERLRHTPRRLSVFVEAPRDAIDGVIAAHETVHRLVDHGWLHLLAIEGDEAKPVFHRRRPGGGWVAVVERPAC